MSRFPPVVLTYVNTWLYIPQGDSGGPLVSQEANGIYVLAGIVSLGHGCGRKEYPGLYANVRHPPHLAWIKNIAFASP